MSYILDALKRSEVEKLAPRTLRAVEEQPIDAEFAEDTGPARHGIVRMGVVAALAVSVGIGIGWWQGMGDDIRTIQYVSESGEQDRSNQVFGVNTPEHIKSETSSLSASMPNAEPPDLKVIGQRASPNLPKVTQSEEWPPKKHQSKVSVPSTPQTSGKAEIKRSTAGLQPGERVVGMQLNSVSVDRSSTNKTGNDERQTRTVEKAPLPSAELQRRLSEVLTDIDQIQPRQPVVDARAVANSSSHVMFDGRTKAKNQVSPVIALADMPSWYQSEVPSMNFEQHIYSSDPMQRWVKAGGEVIFEGQEVEPGVTLQRIEPQAVVLEYSEQQFTLPALAEW